jgi:hypothetical protein
MASFQNPCDVEEARILENAGNDDDDDDDGRLVEKFPI